MESGQESKLRLLRPLLTEIFIYGGKKMDYPGIQQTIEQFDRSFLAEFELNEDGCST